MRKYLVICFEIGCTVEDMTGFYNSLVELFGYGGSVERTKDGEVTDFKVHTDYGVLELDSEKKVLNLDMQEAGLRINKVTSDEMWGLFDKLKKALVIKGDKTWYINVSHMFEVV